jgi:hypothetical protein
MAFLSRSIRAVFTLWITASGASAQAPAAGAPPPPPKTQPPPAPAECTPGAIQVVDLLASLAKFDRDGNAEQKIGFEIPERAINEYLAYSLRNKPRPGIGSVTVTLLPKNEFSAVVSMDFSAIQQWAPEILPEALRALLTGTRTIQVNARFESKNGAVTLTLKDVHGPDGKLLENKIMNILLDSIGSHQPESYNPGKPISLPFGLRRVWTEKQAVLGET